MLRQAYPALTLRELTGDETLVYYALVDRNRGPLTSHGDYRDMLTATAQSVALDLRGREDTLAFGVWLYDKLIVRVDLVGEGRKELRPRLLARQRPTGPWLRVPRLSGAH